MNMEISRLDHFGLFIFVRIVGPNIPEHEMKSECVRRRAETICLNGRSVAQHPTTLPITVVEWSSTWYPLAWLHRPNYMTVHNTWSHKSVLESVNMRDTRVSVCTDNGKTIHSEFALVCEVNVSWKQKHRWRIHVHKSIYGAKSAGSSGSILCSWYASSCCSCRHHRLWWVQHPLYYTFLCTHWWVLFNVVSHSRTCCLILSNKRMRWSWMLWLTIRINAMCSPSITLRYAIHDISEFCKHVLNHVFRRLKPILRGTAVVKQYV